MKDPVIKVNLTVEVSLYNVWGDDCTIGQMKKQAKDEANAVIKSALDRVDARVLSSDTLSIFATDK